MTQCSTCPSCGAPIYASASADPMGVPLTIFTCECRNKVFTPIIWPSPYVQPIQPYVPPPYFPNTAPTPVIPWISPTWTSGGVQTSQQTSDTTGTLTIHNKEEK